MGFLGSLFRGVGKVIGKAKGIVGGGIQLFDKMKGKYDTIKNTISNLPLVGDVASGLIQQGEQKLANVIQQKTGIDPAMIGKGVDIARGFAGTPMPAMPAM